MIAENTKEQVEQVEHPEQHHLLTELATLCSKHDWYYDYSDDHSVWKRGEAEYKKIEELRKDIFLHRKELWEAAEEIYQRYLKKAM